MSAVLIVIFFSCLVIDVLSSSINIHTATLLISTRKLIAPFPSLSPSLFLSPARSFWPLSPRVLSRADGPGRLLSAGGRSRSSRSGRRCRVRRRSGRCRCRSRCGRRRGSRAAGGGHCGTPTRCRAACTHTTQQRTRTNQSINQSFICLKSEH